VHTDATRGARFAAAARSPRKRRSSRADRGSVAANDYERVDPVTRSASAASDTSAATDTPLSERTGCPYRRRDHGAVRGRRPEPGGGAEHFHRAGEVEQLQPVEGHDDDGVGRKQSWGHHQGRRGWQQ